MGGEGTAGRPGYLPAARMIVASAALAGVPERPETSVARLRQLEPALRISNLRDQIPYRRPEDLANSPMACAKPGCRSDFAALLSRADEVID